MLAHKRLEERGLRHQIWALIREHRIVTVKALVVMAHVNGDLTAPCSGNTGIGRYLWRLYLAGVLDRKQNSHGIWQYKLVNDLGERAPVARAHEVYDPNNDHYLDYLDSRIDGQVAAWRARACGVAHA